MSLRGVCRKYRRLARVKMRNVFAAVYESDRHTSEKAMISKKKFEIDGWRGRGGRVVRWKGRERKKVEHGSERERERVELSQTALMECTNLLL